jgi:hypothetical protein
MLKNKKLIPAEHRKYLRLDTVLPVQFRLEDEQQEVLLSGWLQGFTNNISRGGICLAINTIDPELFAILQAKKVKLSLEIDIPICRKAICARASVVWAKDIFGDKHQYLVGVKYDQIAAVHNNKIMRYAWFKKLFVPLAAGLVIILGLGLGINSYLNYKLTQGNKQLIERLSSVSKASATTRQKVEEVIAQRQYYQLKLKTLQEQIAQVESQKTNIQAGDLIQIKQLNQAIGVLSQEKLDLESKLSATKQTEDQATQELVELDEKKLTLEKANFDKMYQWLKIHQNHHTGLVASFEGDQEIANWSFTYDLALIVQAYAYFGDFVRAQKILDFFADKAKRENGWFLNAYYVDDGAPAEFVMHAGPNLWLGLAIMQYTQFSRDRTYLSLAESIAETIINLQEQDPGGGIRGGPNVTWYSTEHNLDAYAFFNMLAQVTQKPLYAASAEKTLSWIVNNTYDSKDLPIKRGKGDSTIATDTYAWSIAAVGPEKLLELGMNPDQILEFVEESCSVEVNFKHPDAQQTVKIKGFDFAPQRHTARGGVVSSEWTAQMVVSYKIMEEFYLKKGNQAKAAGYGNKAAMYLSELGKMIISSASPSGQGEGCLPYATADQVDTGHGWSTPKGSHTGSVSGTTYTLFAYHGFNPLELKE